MKKLLIILGAIFLGLIIIGIIGFSILNVKGTVLDKESKAYVDRVTPIILANLSKETLFRYAAVQLKTSAKPEEFDKIFNWFSKLGEFKQYKGSTGQARVSITNQGRHIFGEYIANVEFETGPATVKITTVKEESDWKIIEFRINSMALAN